MGRKITVELPEGFPAVPDADIGPLLVAVFPVKAGEAANEFSYAFVAPGNVPPVIGGHLLLALEEIRKKLIAQMSVAVPIKRKPVSLDSWKPSVN